jgi:hypothetical protein
MGDDGRFGNSQFRRYLTSGHAGLDPRHAQVDFYESTLRPFAMYRDEESMDAWPDRDEMLGDWKEAFTSNVTNPDGVVETEANFSKPRVIGKATKRRKT